MPMLTPLAGKDAPLETTIERLRARLAALGFAVNESAWLNPLAGVWSVHLRDADCPLLFSNGKGGSELAARASALGEFCERLFSRHFWTHYALGADVTAGRPIHHPQERWFALNGARWPAGLLTPELRRVYDPDGALEPADFLDFNSADVERGICALPATRSRDGKTVWFPANIIGNLYLSNGIAAGNTLAEARTQALSEVVERHVKFRVLREGLCLPDVPEAVIARYPRLAEGIAGLRSAGFGLLVKDASLGGAFPVANVTLLNPHDQGCYASFGAHPRFAVALERALTELLQGRALDALAGFPEPGLDPEEVASAPNIEAHFVDSSGVVGWSFLADTPDFAFCEWDFAGDTQREAEWLTARLHDAGHDVYCIDYGVTDGLAVCRLLVPGVSEVYPIDDLRWENNRVGASLRAAILSLPSLGDDDCAALLASLNEQSFDDARPVSVLIGLAVDAGSFWEDLRIGELKTLLALAIGDLDAIREGCDWIGHFAQLDAARRRVYHCIETLLGLALGPADEAGDWDDDADSDAADDDCSTAGVPDASAWAPWRANLVHLFGDATLAQAEALLAGQQRFFGIDAPGASFTGCAMHARLLAAFARLAGDHA
ncbi:30s ribosomal protein S12 methylthiotransferase accessory protein YcaO [Rhodocyclus tenuis]|uniref:30s ribosomal protein S12 methylthiotransferase accessory protein YcaO n=2 Tax=Rhodocyclus gracilis TaxID=2929842 RepID=A0ABX0WNM3_9RHOO|nr:30s ribosomal protein S12 methylthiotransferase accessory protein YcaO [Rhodocyclus gracilis]NJA90018.1 30s ribosomal protein S12 methylthiotransferase accessory protein YcaO [Rhodocyclus gracilis]